MGSSLILAAVLIPLLALVLLVLPRQAHARGSYEALADAITKSAAKAGAREAQFLPLVSADGKANPQGRMLSAKLLKHIIERDRVSVVMRDLPENLIQGAPSDVVIRGSYLVVRDRIKINVQVVQLPTGKILLAADEDVKNEWPSIWPDFWSDVPAGEKSPQAAAPSLNPLISSPPIANQPASPSQSQAPSQWADVLKPLTTDKAASATKGDKARAVSFSLEAPKARSVELVGGFLVRHGQRMPMIKQLDGTWALTVYLAPGSYRYHFMVDGTQKVMDPRNPIKARSSSVINVPKSDEM